MPHGDRRGEDHLRRPCHAAKALLGGGGRSRRAKPRCISCRKRAGAHGLLCGDCWAKIDFIAPPLCAELGVPLPYETAEPSLSAAAIADPPVYDRARAALFLDHARFDPELQIWGSP